MSHHRKSYKRRAPSNKGKIRTRKHQRQISRKRRYRARGGNGTSVSGNLENYNPAGYSPAGTITSSAINNNPQYYIRYNQNAGLLPNPESTSNRA